MKPTVRRNYVFGSYTSRRQLTACATSQRLRRSIIYLSAFTLVVILTLIAKHVFAEGDAELIDINIVDATVLETLPGIGKVKAQAIVDYREAHGPFDSIEDLIKVKGIGAKTLNNIKNLITVSHSVKKKMAVVRQQRHRLTTWGAIKKAR